MSTPTSNGPHFPSSQGTIYVPQTGLNTSVRINLPVNGPAAPALQQSVGIQPLNDIKSEWTRSMVHMQGNLDNMSNLLSELKVLLGQLKILLGDQAPTDVDDLIESVASAKDSRDDFQLKVSDLGNKVNRFNFDALRGNPGANETVDEIKKVFEEFTKGSLASTQPVMTSGNTQGRTNAVSRGQQNSGANSGATNSPFVFTPPAPPNSGVGTQTATANTASTQTSGAFTSAPTSSTATAHTSNSSTQTSASNTATHTLPPSPTNSNKSTASTNTTNKQTTGVASKPSSEGGTSTSVSGVTPAATSDTSNASAGKSAGLTIKANLSADKKFMIYEQADDFNENMKINHKKSIKWIDLQIKISFENFIKTDKNNFNILVQEEYAYPDSMLSDPQKTAIEKYFRSETIYEAEYKLMLEVLKIRSDRLKRELSNLVIN